MSNRPDALWDGYALNAGFPEGIAADFPHTLRDGDALKAAAIEDDGQELLILVTELTLNPHCARFIGRYGCKEYYERNKELLFYERQQEIIRKMEDIDWDLDEV